MYKMSSKAQKTYPCIKRESNPRRVDGNDPGYHYPINAYGIARLVDSKSLEREFKKKKDNFNFIFLHGSTNKVNLHTIPLLNLS